MNEQITEILNQPTFDRLKDWHDIGPVQKATLELFAELIVKECMEWCDAHATIDGSAQQIRNSIKNHFGVEE